jgi:predicted Holliday junction resolvase-like endonuclease
LKKPLGKTGVISPVYPREKTVEKPVEKNRVIYPVYPREKNW